MDKTKSISAGDLQVELQKLQLWGSEINSSAGPQIVKDEMRMDDEGEGTRIVPQEDQTKSQPIDKNLNLPINTLPTLKPSQIKPKVCWLRRKQEIIDNINLQRQLLKEANDKEKQRQMNKDNIMPSREAFEMQTIASNYKEVVGTGGSDYNNPNMQPVYDNGSYGNMQPGMEQEYASMQHSHLSNQPIQDNVNYYDNSQMAEDQQNMVEQQNINLRHTSGASNHSHRLTHQNSYDSYDPHNQYNIHYNDSQDGISLKHQPGPSYGQGAGPHSQTSTGHIIADNPNQALSSHAHNVHLETVEQDRMSAHGAPLPHADSHAGSVVGHQSTINNSSNQNTVGQNTVGQNMTHNVMTEEIPYYNPGSIHQNPSELDNEVTDDEVLRGFEEDLEGKHAKVLTDPADQAQVFEIDGNHVEVSPGFVLTGTDYGVFMLEAGSRFGTNDQGKLITISPNGTPSELGP